MLPFFKNIIAAHHLIEMKLWPTFASKATNYKVSSYLFFLLGFIAFIICYVLNIMLIGITIFIFCMLYPLFLRKKLMSLSIDEISSNFKQETKLIQTLYISLIFVFSILLPILLFAETRVFFFYYR